jgi:hypothetical protein
MGLKRLSVIRLLPASSLRWDLTLFSCSSCGIGIGHSQSNRGHENTQGEQNIAHAESE